MKLGLLTAAFSRLSLERVAAWASENGYEMLEIACWPAAGGDRRRYAGVSHVDVAKLDAGKVRATLERHGLEVSSLAYYPNNLHPDPTERRVANTHLRKVIDAVRANAIPAVFSESTVSPDPAMQIARETGARYGGVLYVDSLSDPDGPVPTYLDLLRVTTETIAKGLQG